MTKENELQNRMLKARKEISDLEKAFDPNSGCGFGDPDAERMYLHNIKSKKDEEARLQRDCNEITMQQIQKRQLITGWLSAIAAIGSMAAAFLGLYSYFKS